MNYPEEIAAARFEYSKWKRFYAYFGYAFTIAVGTLFIAAVLALVTVTSSAEMWFTAVGTMVLAATMLMVVRLGLKYRYIMYCVYTVSADGILIQRKGASHFTSWAEIEVAEYLWLPTVYRLFAKNQREPIVLFAHAMNGPRHPDTIRTRQATTYLRAGLGDRIKTRIIPW